MNEKVPFSVIIVNGNFQKKFMMGGIQLDVGGRVALTCLPMFALVTGRAPRRIGVHSGLSARFAQQRQYRQTAEDQRRTEQRAFQVAGVT